MKNKKMKISIIFIALLGVLFLIAIIFQPLQFFWSATENQETTMDTSQYNSHKSSSSVSSEIISEHSTSQSTTDDSTQNIITDIDVAPLLASANRVSYGLYYFHDGAQLLSDSQPMVSASVIKVFIMDYIFHQNNLGLLSLDEIVADETILSLMTRMIQVSDNQATNHLIDYIGMDVLNQYFQEVGYNDTELQRKMLDNEAQLQGLENYTSLNDTMIFLKKIYSEQDSYPASEMIAIMSGQTVQTKIRSQLPAELQIANKTGELENVENDIGIIFSDNPFAIVVLSNEVTDAEAMKRAIGEFALAAWER